MHQEPKIVINNIPLTNAQAMTVRVALETFLLSLVQDGLGDDEHGRAMSEGYKDRIREIVKIIHH
jgi:hypothetical protein